MGMLLLLFGGILTRMSKRKNMKAAPCIFVTGFTGAALAVMAWFWNSCLFSSNERASCNA